MRLAGQGESRKYWGVHYVEAQYRPEYHTRISVPLAAILIVMSTIIAMPIATAQNVEFAFAVGIGDVGNDVGYSIALDDADNIYTTQSSHSGTFFSLNRL